MKRRASILFLVAVTAGSAPAVRAGAESIFFVEGLAVDNLEDAAFAGDVDYYRGELPRFPLIDKRKPYGEFKAFQRAMQAKPDAPGIGRAPAEGAGAQMKLARTYADQGDWSQAQRAIEQALQADPHDLNLLKQASGISAAAGRFGVADGYFRRGLALDPENVPLLVGRAGVLIRLYRFDEAEELTAKALKLDPTYLAGYFNRACLRILRSDLEGIEKEWEQMDLQQIEEVGGWIVAHEKDLAPIMSEEGYTLLCDTVIGPGTRPHMADILRAVRGGLSAGRQKKWRVAAVSLEELAKYNLRAYAARMHLGICYAELQEIARALKVLEELSVQYPEETPLLYNRGFVLLRSAYYAEAADVFGRLMQARPDSGEFSFALACAYAGQGLMDDAWPILVGLAQTYPQRMPEWLDGDAAYLRAIRNDPRYANLMALWHGVRL